MPIVIPIDFPPDVVQSFQIALLGLAVAFIAGALVGRWSKR